MEVKEGWTERQRREGGTVNNPGRREREDQNDR